MRSIKDGWLLLDRNWHWVWENAPQFKEAVRSLDPPVPMIILWRAWPKVQQ